MKKYIYWVQGQRFTINWDNNSEVVEITPTANRQSKRVVVGDPVVSVPVKRPGKEIESNPIGNPQETKTREAPPARPRPKADPGVMAFLIRDKSGLLRMIPKDAKHRQVEDIFPRKLVKAKKWNRSPLPTEIVDVVVSGSPGTTQRITGLATLLRRSKSGVVPIRLVRATDKKG